MWSCELYGRGRSHVFIEKSLFGMKNIVVVRAQFYDEVPLIAKFAERTRYKVLPSRAAPGCFTFSSFLFVVVVGSTLPIVMGSARSYTPRHRAFPKASPTSSYCSSSLTTGWPTESSKGQGPLPRPHLIHSILAHLVWTNFTPPPPPFPSRNLDSISLLYTSCMVSKLQRYQF